MEKQQQRDEEILHMLSSARSKIKTGDQVSAQKLLKRVREGLEHYQGTESAYSSLLNTYTCGCNCALSSQRLEELLNGVDFKMFQDALGEAIEAIQPGGLKDLADRDSGSVTRQY